MVSVVRRTVEPVADPGDALPNASRRRPWSRPCVTSISRHDRRAEAAPERARRYSPAHEDAAMRLAPQHGCGRVSPHPTNAAAATAQATFGPGPTLPCRTNRPRHHSERRCIARTALTCAPGMPTGSRRRCTPHRPQFAWGTTSVVRCRGVNRPTAATLRGIGGVRPVARRLGCMMIDPRHHWSEGRRP